MLVHLSDRKHPLRRQDEQPKNVTNRSEVLEMQKQLDVSLNMWYMKHLVVVRNEEKEEGVTFAR